MSETSASPPLGHAIRQEWPLDPGWLSVNHGSFGATPHAVLAAQAEWRARMEAQPGYFFLNVFPAAVREAAERLAAFLGARGADLAFVENATVGCNAVLRSLRLTAGDAVLVLSHGYGAVRNTVRFVTERAGARLIEVPLPFPRPDQAAIVASLQAALTPRLRLAVIDHITSPSGLLLPLAPMIAACRAVGAKVLVDGAHGPGQVPLDLPALGADYYVGNCHKWLCAAKGCGFLWAAPEAQDGLHPVTISHGFGTGFVAEFDWTGTRDPSAFLSVGAALDFHHRLGGPDLMARNVALAREAATLLAARLGTETGGTAETTAAMGLVRLPVAGPATAARATVMRHALLARRVDVPLHAIDGALWLRVSAHAYNEISDYERLAAVVRELAA